MADPDDFKRHIGFMHEFPIAFCGYVSPFETREAASKRPGFELMTLCPECVRVAEERGLEVEGCA